MRERQFACTHVKDVLHARTVIRTHACKRGVPCENGTSHACKTSFPTLTPQLEKSTVTCLQRLPSALIGLAQQKSPPDAPINLSPQFSAKFAMKPTRQPHNPRIYPPVPSARPSSMRRHQRSANCHPRNRLRRLSANTSPISASYPISSAPILPRTRPSRPTHAA